MPADFHCSGQVRKYLHQVSNSTSACCVGLRSAHRHDLSPTFRTQSLQSDQHSVPRSRRNNESRSRSTFRSMMRQERAGARALWLALLGIGPIEGEAVMLGCAEYGRGCPGSDAVASRVIEAGRSSFVLAGQRCDCSGSLRDAHEVTWSTSLHLSHFQPSTSRYVST